MFLFRTQTSKEVLIHRWKLDYKKSTTLVRFLDVAPLEVGLRMQSK